MSTRGFSCLFVALALVAASCGGTDPESRGSTIIVTTSIWSDIVSNVVCDGMAEVETLVPRGADPHAFEPSLADRQALDDSALIVLNGLGLEEGLVDTINASSRAGSPTFRIAEHIATIEFSSSGDAGSAHAAEGEHDHAHEHNDDLEPHSGDDPHVWFDPQRVSSVLPELAARLTAELPLDSDAVAACVSSYQEQLAQLDVEIDQMVAAVPTERRKLVTSHDSLGYFADRYGFQVIGTVIPAPSGLSETNPAQLEALAAIIIDAEVPAIFAETQHSSDDIDALASSLGSVDVVTLNAGTLGPIGEDADSYLGFLRSNAELITRSLS